MNSKEIQEKVYSWAIERDFNAPYGVLTGEHKNTGGRKYLTVAFGRARTLDVSVNIYNKNFITVKTNIHGILVFKSSDELMNFLSDL